MYNYGPDQPPAGDPQPGNNPYGQQPQYPPNPQQPPGPYQPPPGSSPQSSPPAVSAPPGAGFQDPAYQQPMTAPQTMQTGTFPGQFGAPGAQPAKKKNVLTPILAGVCGLLLIATAVFVVLYVNKTKDLTEANAKIDDRDSNISSLEKDVDDLKDKKKDLEDDLAVAEDGAEDAEGLQDCLDTIGEYFNAVDDKKSKDKLKDYADDVNTACEPYW